MKRRELLQGIIGSAAAGVTLTSNGSDVNSNSATNNPVRTQANKPILPLRPGELNFLLGRPCNGKTTLAMSIALDFVEAGKGNVWFFSMKKISEDIATCMGMTVKPLALAKDHSSFAHLGHRSYQAVSKRGPERLYLFDDWYGTYRDLPSIARRMGSPHPPAPGLVIYDADCFDYTTLTADEEHYMALELQERRRECALYYKAPIVVTLGMPSSGDVERLDKTPILSDLRPRQGNSLVDEIYFVYRPALYDDTRYYWPEHHGRDIIVLNRCNRVRPESVSKLLIADSGNWRWHT